VSHPPPSVARRETALPKGEASVACPQLGDLDGQFIEFVGGWCEALRNIEKGRE